MTYESIISEFPQIKAELLFIQERNLKYDLLRELVSIIHSVYIPHKKYEPRV